MSAPVTRPVPLLMGVLNVTPDSFSDGGRYDALEAAVRQGERLLDEGAAWLDVGGESTRPGARPVGAAEELRRVVPVIQEIARRRPGALVSVDTSKAEVAAAAIAAGARIVNDVTAASDPDMAGLCARAGVTLVLMHMRGTPETMQQYTRYDDVCVEVERFLADRVALARAAGVPPERIFVDPGLGFGKAPTDNPRLIAATARLKALGVGGVVIGASRKSFIGVLAGVAKPEDRVYGSIGGALAAVACGADVLRVHDVAATRQALAVWWACMPPSSRAEA